MLLRLATLGVLGLAGLYAAEATGLVETRQYFPSLPRLETSTPADWLSAGTWLAHTTTCLFEGNSLSACTTKA